ncbi:MULTISPECIES: EspA/EspE family type VII secretion system effector [unclassified Mycolicibacterium]|uniref:EspA/EspE family type VII secretion system effector n=1 Tax=unclassified Mycolicibacterium TaxID=2636767 RepID=UPI0012DD8BFE|nr:MULTISPECIES: EspA/EspE family type VII secretion system effector [unclassified Mycolicibacterium]
MGLLGDIADFGKGVIENNLKWTERAAKVGEFIVRNTVGAELGQVAKIGGQIIDLNQKAANFLETQIGQRLIRAAQSPIMAAGQQAIESMKQGTGVGDPENGQRFSEGAAKMGAAGQVLASAFPDDSWDSSGASAYTGRNTEQVGRVQTMLGLDNMVAGVLSTEAGQISAARASLDGHSDWLGVMSLLSTSAGIVPGFGQAARMTAEIAMVAKAVGESSNDINTLRGHINENAAVLRTAAAQYETLAGGAAPAGAEFAPPVGDPQADPGARVPGGPSGGGGGGGTPSGGGGGGGAPTSGPSSAPPMPTGMPGAGSPSSDAAGDAAGALGGILGSLMSPVSGMLGGVMQAAGQAAQAANQAATQAAQMASQAAGPAGGPGANAAQLDKASGDTAADRADAEHDDRADGDDKDRDGKDDKDDEALGENDDEKDGDGKAAEAENDQASGPSAADSHGGQADPLGAGPDGGAAKTLPPDLEAVGAGGGAAGPAPVHVGTDFEQGQLHMAAAATLDRGVPGSAAVIDR